jgi:hypothetical protein
MSLVVDIASRMIICSRIELFEVVQINPDGRYSKWGKW